MSDLKQSKAEEQAVANDFIAFLKNSPSQFHAVTESARRLEAAGYKLISEKNEQDWQGIAPGGKYYFTRNQSTIFAFAVGGKYVHGQGGFSIAAAHTDSPVLKVKPVSKAAKNGFLQIAVECYGGGLWHTWFDRDLSLAGRVIVADEKAETFESKLVQINRPILRIPNLAIHLNREVNEKGFQFNTQNHLYPVLATQIKTELEQPAKPQESKDSKAHPATPANEHHSVLLNLLAEELKVPADRIRNFELCLFDTQPPTLGGLHNEFIFARALDNLMMSYTSLKSLIDTTTDAAHFANDKQIRLVALFDNEECGSNSQYGAASNMMGQVLRRIVPNPGLYDATIARSLLVSADMAHALHPNYAEKHDELHRPEIHKGLVVKQNANQRYATTSVTTFFFNEIAKRHNLPLQKFVVRNDSACGSTIGPILASNSGLRTIDVGIPQLSMHSIREMAGTADLYTSVAFLRHFFQEFPALDASLTVDKVPK